LKKFGHTTEKDYIALGGPETIPRYDYAANVHHRGETRAGISVRIIPSVRDDNQSLAQGFSKNTNPQMIEDCQRMFRQQFEFAAYDLAQGNIEGCTVAIEKGTIPKGEEDFCMEMEKLQAMHHHAADLAHKIQQVLDKDIQTKGGLKRAAEWGHQLQGITKAQHQILTGARLPLPTHRMPIAEQEAILHYNNRPRACEDGQLYTGWSLNPLAGEQPDKCYKYYKHWPDGQPRDGQDADPGVPLDTCEHCGKSKEQHGPALPSTEGLRPDEMVDIMMSPEHQILTGARLPLPTHRPEIQRICHMQMDLLKAQYVDQLEKIEELEQKREHKQGEAPWVWRLSQGFATKQRRWTQGSTVVAG
jgi:hypothetical protein